ncbi:MAG: FAD-dependent oxidoreductase [Pirellula sp.]
MLFLSVNIVRLRLVSFFAVCLLTLCSVGTSYGQQTVERRSVVVYGATPAGIIAAIELKELGRDVLLLEPSEHLGGMTTGGLGATDIGNKQVIGGKSREFYQRVYRYYESDKAWKFQKRSEYKGPHQRVGETSQWTFEPHVALGIFRDWLNDKNVEVRLGAKLDRNRSLEMSNKRILKIPLVDGKQIAADFFIDATYEGDLMAEASVSHAVGREDNATYSETLNGVQVGQAIKHQFFPGISPFKIEGDSKSGLVRGISSLPLAKDGSGDAHVQAYCLRMTLTDAHDNRIPFAKPINYNEEDYELLFRNFAAGLKQIPWHSIYMPNRKTDTNNNTGFSTDFIGMSDAWAEASYAKRMELYEQHLAYQQGLCWTLANHPRVPKEIRDEASNWGMSRDEFTRNGGWSPQLYVREARRMVGEFVMTEHHCRGNQRIEDSIGMAAYTMDSHNVQRVVGVHGSVMNEGDVQVGGFPPYPISFRSIIPKSNECSNLLVPVCLSASHIAYGSIRMEPVFMVLGQSAACATHIALQNQQAIQDVVYADLRQALADRSQILHFP